MRTDRRGIPKEMKESRDREEKSTKYYHSEDNKLLLVSYVGKKKTGKKCNNAFNYAQKGLGNARQEKKTWHDCFTWSHKRRCRFVDLISSKLSVRIKSKSWTIYS